MIIIIPAYKPDQKLIRLLTDLRQIGKAEILLVNDGSGKEYDSVFQEAAPLCDTLLVHPENRGKGAALKTAFSFLIENKKQGEFICTADADGQHLPADIFACLEKAKKNPGTLVLGSRSFRGDVPARSRFGNTVSRHTFHLLMGKRVFDTQTGLRAFSGDLLPVFLAIEGDRYEYEMRMLCTAVKEKIAILEIEIQTVYIEENKSSHFNPVKDALRIYGLLFRFALGNLFELISFIVSSCLAFFIDAAAYYLLFTFLFPHLFTETRTITFFSLLAARILSSVVNFWVNGKMVFQGLEKPLKSFFFYALLVVGIFFANEFILSFFLIRFQFHASIAHVLAQVICFPISFLVQKFLIFRKPKENA